MNQPNLASLRNQAAIFAATLASCGFSAAAQTTPRIETSSTKPERRIVVSLLDRKLALLEGDRVVRIYNVAVGRADSPSPNGEYRIAQRLENPAYYKPGVVIGPGKDNPLGRRWIGLDVKGFGIHGTNRPASIGKNASHGCIRLRNRDIEDLFTQVHVGDRVSLVGERTEEVARLFGGEADRIVANSETGDAQGDDTRGER